LEQEDHIVLCVDRDELEQALAVLGTIREELGAQAITNDPQVASISLFGLDFRAQSGVASRMCQALGSCNINIRAISTSLSTITCVIEAQRLDDAIQVLRETFTLD
jgi:aspartate kinase